MDNKKIERWKQLLAFLNENTFRTTEPLTAAVHEGLYKRMRDPVRLRASDVVKALLTLVSELRCAQIRLRQEPAVLPYPDEVQVNLGTLSAPGVSISDDRRANTPDKRVEKITRAVDNMVAEIAVAHRFFCLQLPRLRYTKLDDERVFRDHVQILGRVLKGWCEDCGEVGHTQKKCPRKRDRK